MTMDEYDGDIDAEYNRKRSLDRRRESSRFAARDRRGKEADIFTDLKEVVPVVDEATVTHVDRIALLRVASTLCRLRKIAAKIIRTDACEERAHVWSEATLLESLDGFLAIIDLDGIILYVTESVSVYLGLTQTDLTGRSLKEFVHASDYEEFTTNNAGHANDNEIGRMLTLRMKSVISPRGRNLNLKSALFKSVVCRVRTLPAENGRVRILHGCTQPAGQGSCVAVAAKSAEVPNGTYMTRHTCDMKFIYVSENFNYILRHEPRSLTGTSFYNLVHPADLQQVVVSIREMLAKGHARTPYYRLIGVNKSVLWVQTEATTVNHTTKGHKGQYVICIHDLLGSQSERESFTIGRSDATCATAMDVKREVEDNQDTAKSNYDEVLQWLFRAQQRNESPPETLFRAQSNKSRNRLQSSEQTTAGMQTISYGTKNGITVSGTTNGYQQKDCPNTAFTNNGGVEFGALANGNSRRGIRSTSGARANCSGGAAHGGSRNCTAHCFQADFPSDPTAINTLQLPAVPTTDPYVLSNSNNVNGGATTAGAERNAGNMFTTLPATGTQYARSIGYEPPPYLIGLSAAPPSGPMNSTTEISRIAHRRENNGTEPMETAEDWQMFAPYVAHDDMVQLSADLQGLLPEFNFIDWIPSDPAPLPTLPSGERITTVESIPNPMQMAFGRPDLYANSGIPSLSKSNSFDLPGFSLTPGSMVGSAAATKRGIAFGLSKENTSEMNSLSASASWRHLQQQYQQHRMQQQQQQQQSPAIGAPWTELASACTLPNDPALTFHRNSSAVQQQQRV